MKLCSQCEIGYPDSELTCPIHGCPLVETGDLPSDLLICGTYRIQNKLGQGSMGSVYLAKQVPDGELKALKFISPELSQDESFSSRFERAAKRLSDLHHPNLLATGDLQRAEDDSLFFPMEFVGGPSLRVLLNIAPEPFGVDLALAITRSVTEGLQAAHAAGMIHLDLKPENILIARYGDSLQPKIANFGIGATREDGSTFLAAGQILLTPTYAAPEQWLNTRSELLDGRTDFYALGGILFEMLTRETVFDAVGYHAWARQHLTTPPRKPSELRPELAGCQGLDNMVLTLLAKEPKDRPRDAAALLALLDEVQFGPLVSQAPQTHSVEEATPASEPDPPSTHDSAPEAVETSNTISTTDQEPIRASEFTDPASQSHTNESAEQVPEIQIEALDSQPDEPSEFTEPELLDQPPAATEPEYLPTDAFAAQESEPVPPLHEVIPAVEPEPPSSEPALPVSMDAPTVGEEATVEPNPPHSFNHPFRPDEPEFTATEPDPADGPAQGLPSFWTPAAHADEKAEQPTMDAHELQRLFGRMDSGVRFEDPPRRRTAPISFFDDPPGAEQPMSTDAGATEFAFSAYSPAGADAPPVAQPDLPAAFPGIDTFPLSMDVPEPAHAEPSFPWEQPDTVAWIDTGRDADPATLRAAMQADSHFSGGDPAARFNVRDQDSGEVDDSERHPRRTVPIVLAAMLVLAVAGFATWRFGFNGLDLQTLQLTRACTSGDGKACYDVGAWYEQNRLDSNGHAQAMTSYAKACDFGFPLACRKLGLKYLYGTGVAIDMPKAIERFGKACDKADAESCDSLGAIYHEGKGVPMDDGKALAIYSKACASGDQVGCTWAKRLTPAPPVKPKPRPAKPASADSDTAQ